MHYSVCIAIADPLQTQKYYATEATWSVLKYISHYEGLGQTNSKTDHAHTYISLQQLSYML
jgi:hypothetical protein